MSLKAEDIQVGRTFAAKKVQTIKGLLNDRRVMRITKSGAIEFDGPSVGLDGHFCIVPVDHFLAWAQQDVSDAVKGTRWRKALVHAK